MKKALGLVLLCSFSTVFGATVKLDYVLDPSQFGLDANGFGTAICVDGNRIAVHQSSGNGLVHVFNGSTATGFTKQRTITSPDTTYNRPSFGESLGFRGNLLYVGSPLTWRVAPHDGIAYLFNLNDGSLKESWTESPHAAEYFAEVGGIRDDVLYVCQGENPGWQTKSGVFLYSLTESGTRTPIWSFIQPETGIETVPIGATHNRIFVSSRVNGVGDQTITIYDIMRDGTGSFTGVLTNSTITSTNLFCSSFNSIAVSDTSFAFGNPIYTNGSVSCGAVFIYTMTSPQSWTLTSTIYPPTPDADAFFGAALDYSQGKLIVGSPGYNSTGTKPGCVYIYDLDSSGSPVNWQRYQPAEYKFGQEEIFGAALTHTTDGVVVGSGGGVWLTGLESQDINKFGKGALYFLSFGPSPLLEIKVSKVKVTQHLIVGHKYVLESSSDLNTWTQVGAQFTADSESITQEYDVDQIGRYFQLREIQ